jgi:hypothetical protein
MSSDCIQKDSPYLSAMIDYVQFGTHAWNQIVDRNTLANGQSPSRESLKFFHYQLHRWHQELDPAVKFDVATIESDGAAFFARADAGHEIEIYLKTLLYLRSNQIQILVLRPMLVYSRIAGNNPSLVADVIAIARKSVQALSSLATKTTLYIGRHVIFNHFLSSAMTVLFLAVAHEIERQAGKLAAPQEPCSNWAEILGSISEGFAIINRHRSLSQSAARLWTFFERPRHQLAHLGSLGFHVAREADGFRYVHGHGIGQNCASTNTVQAHGGDVENGASLDLDFVNGNDAAGVDFLGTVGLDLDWLEDDAFTDPSASFGLRYWM